MKARDSRRKSAKLERHQARMVGLVRVRAAGAALVVALATAGVALPVTRAVAEQQSALLANSRRDVTPVARFACQGGPSFVLDQSGPRALLRFEGGDEIWVLRPRAGPRGDVFYRNDVNEPVLRATRLGGVTLYTSDRPGGLPCAPTATSQPLRMAEFDAASLFRHLLRERARGVRALDHGLFIDLPEVDRGEEPVFGDAVTLAVDGMARLTDNGSRQAASRVRTVLVTEGPSPSVTYGAGVLHITVAPRLGVAGRPSSARVMRAILSN